MPTPPPTLLAPLALDSRFCARSLRPCFGSSQHQFSVNYQKLRAPSALPAQNPSVKLGEWKKGKLGRALADVDSDSPLFVDALEDQGRRSSAVTGHPSQGGTHGEVIRYPIRFVGWLPMVRWAGLPAEALSTRHD
ncbi:hypothetical protein Bbelb_205210 [Branchiostoma belcheri]|nr:hypothetical protein Bbelb_205210 [Branchiostoma belcheri]